MARWSLYRPDAETLAPGRTALLLIDIQNDFGHPDGVMGKAGVDLSRVDPAVDAAIALADAARAASVPVIIVSLETTAQLDSRAASLRRGRMGMPDTEDRRVCRKGSWGAAPYRLLPAPGDIAIAKARYASFQDTTLDRQLATLGVDTLIIGGLTTECCVEAAVRDAFHRDFNVFLAVDACASYDPAEHDVCVGVMARYCALIVSSADVAATWATEAKAA
jgi:ureidoacrylate peracid hydrolase